MHVSPLIVDKLIDMRESRELFTKASQASGAKETREALRLFFTTRLM